VVSRAFQILSDEDKKSRYDKFGGDPDSRFNPGPSASSGASPFSGFSSGGFPRGGGRGPAFEEEISPEELFNRFFSGGFGGMGGGGFGMSPYALNNLAPSYYFLDFVCSSRMAMMHINRPKEHYIQVELV